MKYNLQADFEYILHDEAVEVGGHPSCMLGGCLHRYIQPERGRPLGSPKRIFRTLDAVVICCFALLRIAATVVAMHCTLVAQLRTKPVRIQPTDETTQHQPQQE